MFITEDRFSQELWTFRFGASCFKGVIVLSQASICWLEFDCAGCTESLKSVSQVSRSVRIETKLLLALNLNLNSNLWVFHWTIPVKDWYLQQIFLENKGFLIVFWGSLLEYNAHDVICRLWNKLLDSTRFGMKWCFGLHEWSATMIYVYIPLLMRQANVIEENPGPTIFDVINSICRLQSRKWSTLWWKWR